MKRALSLIEILVAVSIIGIIATIAIPNLESARIQADTATLMSYVDAQELAWTLYLAEEDLKPEDNGGNAAPAKVLALLEAVTTEVHWRLPATYQKQSDGSYTVATYTMTSRTRLVGPAGVVLSSDCSSYPTTRWLRVAGATGLGPSVFVEGGGIQARARIRALYHMIEQRGWLVRYSETPNGWTGLRIAIWAHGRPPLKGSPSSAGNGSGS